jgi:hypothetical protein
MYPEFNDLRLPQLIELFWDRRFDSVDAGDGSIYYSEVAWRIVQRGHEGLQFLLDTANNCSVGQLRGILVALSFPPCLDDPRIDHLIEACLDNSHPIIIADAIRALASRGKAELINRVLSFQNHSCEYVRGSVLVFMRRLYPQQSLLLLLDALHDPHYIVRESAIDELDDLGDVSAISAIEPFLTDPEGDVRQAARTAIENLMDRLRYPEDYLEDGVE